MKQKNGKMKSRLLLLLALLLMVPVGVFAQNITVKGTVTDSQGETVIGATVVEKGNTSNGVTTDLDGHFTLTVAKGKKLVISYIGMETQELDAVAGKELKVVLKDDSQALDEVVVIGYGSKARKDLTGSVGSVSGAKLAAVPVTSAAVALQGKIAGVQVTTVDGAPGADINIRVRGGTSVTQSNDPLYIVDGFQVDNINDIPPTDIASIDVLKDASLTAIYGAKGGNGVVIVTTKSAQQGKITVGVNAQMSVSKLSKKLDLMDAYDYVQYQYDWAASNGGMRSGPAKYFRANFGNPNDLDLYKYAPTHDWQDQVMGETPLNYSTNVTVGGGSEKFRFNTSLTQSEDKGIILGSGVRRTNLNVKINAQLTKNLTLTMNPRFTYRRDTGAGGDKVGSGGIIDVLRYRPSNGLREFATWDPATVDPDDEAIFAYTNPKSDIGQNVKLKHAYSYTNQFSLDWKPIEGLTLRTEAAHSIQFSDENNFFGRLTKTGQDNSKMPVAEIKDKRKEIVRQLEMLGDCVTEMELEYKRDLIAADSFIVEAYDTVGKEVIEQLKYSKKKIMEAMIRKQYSEKATGTEVIRLIKNSFTVGQKYTRKYTKEEIKRIYALLNIHPPKAITSKTISDFFMVSECKVKGERCYLLIEEIL